MSYKRIQRGVNTTQVETVLESGKIIIVTYHDDRLISRFTDTIFEYGFKSVDEYIQYHEKRGGKYEVVS